MKPKALRKLIQQHFKKVAALSELDCMFKFFDLLRAHYRFDQERFICALGVSESVLSTTRIVSRTRLDDDSATIRIRPITFLVSSQAGLYPWN